jgi:hypothetical protein
MSSSKLCFPASAWSGGIVSARHREDWSYGSLDLIPVGYRVVAFFKKMRLSASFYAGNLI